jgi:hypothetical protein
VKKEAEIVAKNLFGIHSKQKVIFSGCWNGEHSPIRPACIWDGKLRTAPERKYRLESSFCCSRP